MPLSVEEIAIAKKAYSEIRTCDQARTLFTFMAIIWLFMILSFGIFIACGMQVDEYGKELRGWDAFLSFLMGMSRPFFFCALPSLGQAVFYYRLKPRYADNLRVVTEMEKRHAGELPYGLEEELQRVSDTKPRKALLWRLDALLSRKPVSA